MDGWRRKKKRAEAAAARAAAEKAAADALANEEPEELSSEVLCVTALLQWGERVLWSIVRWLPRLMMGPPSCGVCPRVLCY